MNIKTAPNIPFPSLAHPVSTVKELQFRIAIRFGLCSVIKVLYKISTYPNLPSDAMPRTKVAAGRSLIDKMPYGKRLEVQVWWPSQ